MKIFVLVLLCIAIILLFTLLFDDLFFATYRRKDRKLWKYFIDNVSNFQYQYTYDSTSLFIFDEYTIVYWGKERLTSVHLPSRHVCILSDYDEKASKSLAEKIELYFPEVNDMPDCVSDW